MAERSARLSEALAALKERRASGAANSSVHAVAHEFGVSKATLWRHDKQLVGKPGPPTVLSAEYETLLVTWIMGMCVRLRTPPKYQVLCVAAELEAEQASMQGREPRWPVGGPASVKWWRGFKKRHGVRLRNCQVCSASAFPHGCTTMAWRTCGATA